MLSYLVGYANDLGTIISMYRDILCLILTIDAQLISLIPDSHFVVVAHYPDFFVLTANASERGTPSVVASFTSCSVRPATCAFRLVVTVADRCSFSLQGLGDISSWRPSDRDSLTEILVILTGAKTTVSAVPTLDVQRQTSGMAHIEVVRSI